jgi:signal transduction histidine kinase
VRDNGPGKDPSEHDLLFDKYRKGRDQPGAKGSGLGLHISRQIVEHIGGRMWVESAPGQGACFSFTLPT